MQGPLTALLLTFSSKTVNRNMKHEAAQKQTKVMNDEVEKQGVLKTIIYKACKIKEVALGHLGRDGKRGYLAFRNFTVEKRRKSGSSRLSTELKVTIRSLGNLIKCLGRTINTSLTDPLEMYLILTCIDGELCF